MAAIKKRSLVDQVYEHAARRYHHAAAPLAV